MDCELYHYGVKGMKWGVRKSSHNSGRNTSRMVTRLNRANTKMEKYKSLQTHLNQRNDLRKKTKNPFVKAFSLSFTPDRRLTTSRYDRAKKKVDTMLTEMDKQGVAMKDLKVRKTGLTVGLGYNYVTTWTGVKYVLDE